MSAKPKYKYPSDDEILKGFIANGCNWVHYCESIGFNNHTLESYARRQRGLWSKIEKARRKNLKRGLTPVIKYSEEVSQEEIYKKENQELRKELNEARSDKVQEERVKQLLEKNLKSKSPRYKPSKFVRKQPVKHEFVLQWSDVHAAEVVSLEETNGANEYSWEIMLKRHDKIRQGVLSYQENRPYPVDVLHICSLGDMLSGNIHEELSETNEMPMAEAVVQFGLDAAEWIESFVPHFKKIRIACVVGNHPREKRKQPSKHRFSNGDWISYQVMQQRLAKYDNIEFEIPKPQMYAIQVYDKKLLLLHGDGIKSTMVDVPWGGIIRYTNKLQNQYAQMGIPIDHFLLGHYHESNIVKNRKIIMNGSVLGINEWSLDRFGGGSDPAQNLLTFHKDRGLVDASWIDCA